MERGDDMTFRELRQKAGMTQKAMAEYFHIPQRTVEEWDAGRRKVADYLLELMVFKLQTDGKIKAED